VIFINRIRVPEDISEIQMAINSADDGDELLVSPGKYRENIDYRGKDLKIRSINPADKKCRENTIISGQENVSTVRLINDESRDAILEGFTIRNGKGMDCQLINTSHPSRGSVGGGILIQSSSPIIKNNIIDNNYADYGGGVALIRSNSLLENNEIIDNEATSGGGIFISGIIPHESKVLELNNNKINCNNALRGGGLSIEFCETKPQSIPEDITELESGIKIKNNVINKNKASEEGGGINILEIFNVLFVENIVAKNIVDGKDEVLGAGFHIWEANFLKLIKNTIINNTLTEHNFIYKDRKPGAGICLRDSDVVMEKNNIKNNYIKNNKKTEDNLSLYFDAIVRNEDGTIIDLNYY